MNNPFVNDHDHAPDRGVASGPRRRWVSHAYIRVIAYVAAGFAVVVILCCCALTAFLNSTAGHRYLLDLAQQKASAALGVPVRLQNFTLHLAGLSVDLYGIRIAGAAPHSDPPLLQADHLRVGVRIVSALSRTWYLDQVEIDHPVAWLVVDRNGVSNLPAFQSSGSGHTDIFDLGIRRVQITRGEVYYNSRPQSLSANLHDLAFKSTFSSLLRRYSGTVSYSRGNLSIGSFRPLEHRFEAEFDAAPAIFTLKHAGISAGASSVTLSATVENFSAPLVNAEYQIVLDGRQAAQILHEPDVPSGSVRTWGTLKYQQSANQNVVEALTINGELASTELTLQGSVRAGIANLSAHYSLAGGNASLESLRGHVLGGELNAEGTMQAIGGNTHSNFHVDLKKVSLAALEQALGSSAPGKNVSLNGTANATATATWGKTIDDLMAHADLTVNGNATRPRSGPQAGPQQQPAGNASQSAANVPAAAPVIPLQGAFHAVYSNANRDLTLNNSYLKSSQTNLLLNGTMSRQSSLSVQLQANDLSEIAAIADAFRAPGSNAQRINLSGRASFQGTVRGTTASPDLTGQLTADNLEYNGTKWKLLRTGVELSPARASLQNISLQSMDRGQMTGNASVGLRDWSPSGQSLLQADLTALDFPAATIATLAGRSIPVTGTLNVSAHLHGTVFAPTGNASVRLTSATAFGEPVTQATIDLTGSGKDVKAVARIQLPAGTIQSDMTTDPAARTYTAQLSSSGIDLAKLQAVTSRGINAQGVVTLQLHGQGSFDDPALDGAVEIPKLTVGGQVISQTKLQLNAAHHVANVELASSFGNTPLHGNGQIHLDGDYQIDASLDTGTLPLEPLLAAYEPEEQAGMTGQLEVHATAHGPLKNKNQLQAQVKIPVLKIAYNNNVVQLEASSIQADYANGIVRLQPVTLRGTDTELSVQGAFPLGSQAPASLEAHGAINLAIAQIFDSDLRASGQLKLNIDSHGTTAGSLLAGEIDVSEASLGTDTSPVSLQHANGVLKLTSDRIEIAKLEGTVGGGSVSAQGAVTYRPNVQMNVGLTVRGAQMLYPQGVRETADANLRFIGSTTNASLSGAVNLTDMSFTPAFDLNALVNQLSGGVEVPQQPGFAQNLQLNIAVNSSGNANLVSRTLSVDGTANLQVRGTAAEPVVLGRVNLSGGDVILSGNRYVLTGGTIQFINPSLTEPILNVGLTTTIQQYKIDLRFRGSADQMRTQYTSDPALPQADIINLLAFGQTTEASAMNATPMNQQAEGLVASQVSSQVTSRISKAEGISQLSISPVLAGSTAAGPPGANLTIQQRVTGNLFVTFSTNVATTQGQTIQGQYQVSPRVTVSATRDPNGGFAVDTLIKKSF
jgi:translocation and assembly module TamB